MKKKRKPRVSPEYVEVVVGLLHGWTGKLTWPLLIAAAKERTGLEYTRQNLMRYSDIFDVFGRKKDELRGAPGKEKPKSIAEQRIQRLQNELATERAKNKRLLDRHARWVVNASMRGLTEEDLDEELIPIERAKKG